MSDINNGNVVGIDLGTTYSAIARVKPSGDIEVIPNSDGQLTTPSVVYMDGDNILVGEDAVKVALLEPTLTAECFKRDMGRAAYSKLVDGKEMRPEVLSAFVLKKLKQDAEQKVGSITEAVVTVPAFFDETRRKATQDACKIAGIPVSAIINEPSAAALWYGYGESVKKSDSSVFMVYDLGGGTFDVTLMRIVGNNDFETIATGGASECGGKDWNDCLINYLVNEFDKSKGVNIRDDAVSLQNVALSVENCKRTLSKLPTVNVPVSCGGAHARIPVSKELFEELTLENLTHTQIGTELLLQEAGLSWGKVNDIILVGGSTHLPMVKNMLERISGKTVKRKLDVEVAVVQGAAVYAASLKVSRNPSLEYFDESVTKKLSDLKHTNVNAHSLGIESENPDTGRPENQIIIPKNTPIPCKKMSKYETSAASINSGAKIQVTILEGEASNPEACIVVGNCFINVPAGLPANSPVDVTFAYTRDGRIHVTAVATAVNKKAEAHIDPHDGLSPEQIKKYAEEIESLKIA